MKKLSIYEIEIIGLTSGDWLALRRQQEVFEAEQEDLAIEAAESVQQIGEESAEKSVKPCREFYAFEIGF